MASLFVPAFLRLRHLIQKAAVDLDGIKIIIEASDPINAERIKAEIEREFSTDMYLTSITKKPAISKVAGIKFEIRHAVRTARF